MKVLFTLRETMKSKAKIWSPIEPYVAIIFMQFGLAGLAIIAKFALNDGMSSYSFVVYRQAVAAIFLSPFAFVLERYVPSI